MNRVQSPLGEGGFEQSSKPSWRGFEQSSKPSWRGFEIAVPDYSTGTIKWAKISSIKQLEPQHVYDLSIEGTRNFIANDIVAHNTYLATSSGNVGIGTTSPLQKLHVEGQCVAEDSLITLADGSKKKIKDIKEGDLVQSLDEATGMITSNRVTALLDMGNKTIFEITTEPYRAINTTGNHPYLVKLDSKEECDKYKDTVWNKEADEFSEYCTRWVEVEYLTESNEIAVPIIENDLNNNDNHKKEKNGFHSQATAPGQNPVPSRTESIKQYLYKYLSVDEDILTELGSHSLAIAPDSGSGFLRGSAGSNSLSNEMDLPPPASKSSSDSDILWAKIISIKVLDKQQVYDLAIEGTHNFIANDIVAHNTFVTGFVNFTNNTAFNQTLYLVNGNLGIGTTSPL